MSLHIGILQTDSVLAEFQPEHGNYPGMFECLLSSVADGLTFTTYDVQRVIPEDLVCDVYLITGSRHSVYDDLPWIAELAAFVDRALTVRKKIIGVCFGHQLMAHFFGGRVAAHDGGWAVGVHHSKVVSSAPWMPDEQGDFALLSSHKDQVQELPPDAQLYLSNSFCPIAGFTMGDQVITVQGHPEFSAAYAKALLDHRRDLYGESLYKRSVSSLDQATSEQAMVRWLLAFVGERDGR